MSDNQFDFGDERTPAGFRLARLEFYNWGTFNNRVWVLPLEGANGLLTGDIGSGKSTIVDAINTLLVPPARVTFNRAAGADRRERDLRSYVLGYYRSERTLEGSTSKPVALRGPNSYTVILAVFTNVGFGQTVTIAQVLRQKEGQGQPARFYVVADRDLSIRGEFSDFGGDLSRLRKRLRETPGVEPVFDSFPPYSAAFRRRLGLKNEQALLLFHQTVSMKSVGNLTDFVREHMLEPFEVEPRIEALLHHFDDLYRAHEAVRRAKEQIERLSRIEELLERHAAVVESEAHLRFCRDGLRVYFAALRARLLEERVRRYRQDAAKLAAKRVSLEESLVRDQNERDNLRAAIAENGGDRLAALQAERTEHQGNKRRRVERFESYSELARELGLSEARDEPSFVENMDRVDRLLTESRSEIDRIQNELSERGVTIRSMRDEHATVAAEIESLRGRRSNIDAAQVALRRRLCDALGLQESELPFVGELLQVKESEAEWEGAIERLLRNFGLSMLVPPDHYAAVSDWVDRTDLRGRLVYFRVRAEEEPAVAGTTDQDYVPNKLEIKPDTPWAGWLREEIERRFDYLCCRTVADFRRAGKALTRAGQVKGSPTRHEKDDRHPIGDRRRYVLGWRNESKVRVLESRSAEIEAMIGENAEAFAALQRESGTVQTRQEQSYRLRAYAEFSDLDWKPIASRIEAIDREIVALQRSNDVLATLNGALRTVETRIRENRSALDTLLQNAARLEERIESAETTLAEDTETVERAPVSPARITEAIEPVRAEMSGGRDVSVENADKYQQDLREWLQAKIDAESKQMRRLSEQIIQAMQNFRHDYPAESGEMDASLEAAEAFLTFLANLRADDLPRFETRFKTLLNENTIREIANFQAQLGKESRIILERIDSINRSLRSIEYEKDRFIRLEAPTTHDQDIRSFQQELRACTSGTIGTAADEQYTEAKFEQVKAIIDRFRGREGSADIDRRWTQKVTDVRNWFSFAASERWTEDESEYEHYTDSGGKSGGQKEKLAYTVLAASVAYQFGLEWGERRSRSFRFVVIDEAFGRGSDESARFGLRLFSQLDLQLLVVTPLQKLHIIEPFVSTVGFVHNNEGKDSLLRCLTIEEYRAEREARLTRDAAPPATYEDGAAETSGTVSPLDGAP